MDITELVYIDETGYNFKDYPSFLTWRQDQVKSIYGADTYLEPDSQDGQLTAIKALADYQTAALGASVYNSFSPLFAQGVGLSTRVKINGINRRIATNSTADLLIVGTAGTLITNGIAQDSLNQKWNLPVSVTIPGGGSITVTATAQELGDIAALPNTINKIFTPTLGWQTVNNIASATVGAPVETDAELRIRQQISVANPSLTVFEGTVGAVGNVSGVTAVRGYENDTSVVDSNGLPDHSISLVVAGGATVDVAQAIALHKTPGTGTYGTTTQLVFDSKGMPININFFRPTVQVIKSRVTISAKQGWSADFIPLIQQAVANAIEKFGIGSSILVTQLYVAAYLVGTPAGQTYDISLLEIAKNANPFGTVNVDLLFNEQPSCDYLVNVTIVVT